MRLGPVGIASACRDVCAKEGVPLGLAVSVAIAESNGDPEAKRFEPDRDESSFGLFQVLESTAPEVLTYVELVGRTDAGSVRVDWKTDPELNARAGVRYLRWCFDRYGEIRDGWSDGNHPATAERWRFAVAAYNAGRGNVNAALSKARRVEGRTINQSGEWQKWWFTCGFLHRAGRLFTTKHVSTIWGLWISLEEGGALNPIDRIGSRRA